MRAKTSSWYEASVKYLDTEGHTKRERYIIEATSFTEAEARLNKELETCLDLQVKTIRPTKYGEVWFADDGVSESYYKVKVAYIFVNEKTGKEKRTVVPYLVQGNSIADALREANNMMSGSATDYVSIAVSETKYVDVIEKTNQ